MLTFSCLEKVWKMAIGIYIKSFIILYLCTSVKAKRSLNSHLLLVGLKEVNHLFNDFFLKRDSYLLL